MYHSLLGPIVCGQGLLDDDPYKKDNKAKTHSAHAGEFSVTVALPIRVTPIGPSKPIKPRTSVTLQAPYKVPTFVRRELEALASSSQASSTFVRLELAALLSAWSLELHCFQTIGSMMSTAPAATSILDNSPDSNLDWVLNLGGPGRKEHEALNDQDPAPARRVS
jgi:hypothetical protein